MDPASSHHKLRLVVLVSGVGSLMNSVVEATHDPAYPAEIVAVGADRPCAGLERAAAAGLELSLIHI